MLIGEQEPQSMLPAERLMQTFPVEVAGFLGSNAAHQGPGHVGWLFPGSEESLIGGERRPAQSDPGGRSVAAS
jgi:hypothetical protein